MDKELALAFGRMMRNQTLQLDHEWQLNHFNGGIKLLRADDYQHDNKPRLSDALKVQADVCFCDAEGAAVLMNDKAITRSGLVSLKDVIGKSVFDVAKSESAQLVALHHAKTLKSKSLTITEYDFIRHDELYLHCLLISQPWYQEDNKIKGILDFAIVEGRDSMALSLASLIQLGVLDKPIKLDGKFGNVCLSRRETECLKLLTQGKKSKEIGLILNLSSRTIEHYLQNCMNKLNASNRSELVARFMRLSAG